MALLRQAAVVAGDGADGDLLPPAALDFLAHLQRELEPSRREVLVCGPGALDPGRSWVEGAGWRAPDPPPDLRLRDVLWVGTGEPAALARARAAGAPAYAVDLEAAPPAWQALVAAHRALAQAVRAGPRLATAVLLRPRSLVRLEPRVRVDGEPMSAALFDLGLFLYHCARPCIERESGPYVVLAPRTPAQARLWEDAIVLAQDLLGLPLGNVQAVVRVAGVGAARDLEPIAYELRRHLAAVALGGWEYAADAVRRLPPTGLPSLPGWELPPGVALLAGAGATQVARVARRRGLIALAGPVGGAGDACRRHDAGPFWLEEGEAAALGAAATQAVAGPMWPPPPDDPGPFLADPALLVPADPVGHLPPRALREAARTVLAHLALRLEARSGVGADGAEAAWAQLGRWLAGAVPLPDGRPLGMAEVEALLGEEGRALAAAGAAGEATLSRSRAWLVDRLASGAAARASLLPLADGLVLGPAEAAAPAAAGT
jgi:hypothetical protein